MIAFILAGGKGTRLSSVTKNEIPKPMALINGKPILEHAILNLKEFGISTFYISVGHLHKKIEEYFKDGKNLGVNINYVVENEPLGSGGALYYVKDKIKEDFLVCSGDAIFSVDLSKMYQFHKSKNAKITLLAHPNLHPYDSDLVFINKNNLVTQLNLKNSPRDFYYKNLVNAGMFIISPKALEYFKSLRNVNMEHDFVSHFIEEEQVYAYVSCEYIKDVGTPERFMLAEKDLQSGLVFSKNLKNKQKAIFLDRDGTINIFKNFIKNASEIELISGTADAIKLINNSGYLAIVVSNQPVIARGEATFEDVDYCFNKIETLLGESGAYLDGIYYCPHHPHKGYAGEIKDLKIICDCRKPNIGLINKAKEDFNLDLSKCFMVGDSNLDIQTAINANIKSIRVKTGVREESPLKADFTFNNLLEAMKEILKGEKE